MQIKQFLLISLVSGLALNVQAQPGNEQKDNKQQMSRPEQPNAQEKNRQAMVKKNQADKRKPFIPSEKVSPDIPVSFPADI